MNRNLLKALLLVSAVGTVATVAHAQATPPIFPPPIAGINNGAFPAPPPDWVNICYDFSNTSLPSPYSTDYNIIWQYDSLFGASVGLGGTVNFSKVCFGPSGLTLPVTGRVGFYIGTDWRQSINGQANPDFGKGGSTQDNIAGSVYDDGMSLTFGGITGVAGNWSIANIVQDTVGTNGATTRKMEQYGKNAIDVYYNGLSDRYLLTESSTSLGIRVRLRIDVIGDTARTQWQLENTTTATNTKVGLWFGQYIWMSGAAGPHSADFITVPGRKPINGGTRFALNPNGAATSPPEYNLPPYVNFGASQSNAYGLQVVLTPTTQIPDQTQADGIDIGSAYTGFIFTTFAGTDGGMPDNVYPDVDIASDVGYIEKFNPIPVGAFLGTAEDFNPACTRTVVAYYRSTWSSGDYAKPYSLILDAPPVVATSPGDPSTFQNAPIAISVLIDDTRGFTTNDQSVSLEDVEIDLDLPPGMADVNNPGRNHMVKFLNQVSPQTVAHVTFNVSVDPTLFGNQQYTVTVKPNPGLTKVLNGTIVVASQPYLQLTGTANLVTAPWNFASSDWATIIGSNSGLVLDQDYQVFGWDAKSQTYVLQTDPQRGFGSFVVSNKNVGFVPLGGSPQQFGDIQTGAPQIILQPGWNMIANPYNYAIPLGELIGVPEADNQNSYTFSQLANLSYVSGFLAFWSPLTQGYEYTTSFTDLIQPNTGYWIFVQSNQPVTIQYPPVFQAFLPNLIDNGFPPPSHHGESGLPPGSPLWSLQLAARSGGAIDGKTSIGQTTTPQLAANLTRFKAPAAPVKNAISSSILSERAGKTVSLAQALTSDNVTSQTWTWQVYTKTAGPVTLTWPNMKSVPNNVQVKLIDAATGTKLDLRKTATLNFMGQAKSVHKVQLVVTTGPSLPVIESLSASAGAKSAAVSYSLSVNATTTVTVQQGSQVIATLVSNRADNSGASQTSWNYLDLANRRVKAGVYQIIVSSTPSGGSAATKSTVISVGR